MTESGIIKVEFECGSPDGEIWVSYLDESGQEKSQHHSVPHNFHEQFHDFLSRVVRDLLADKKVANHKIELLPRVNLGPSALNSAYALRSERVFVHQKLFLLGGTA